MTATKRTGQLIAVLLLLASAEASPGVPNGAAPQRRLSQAIFDCTERSQLIACDDAMHLKPGDPALLIAEADTLVRLQRPGEAIGVYRNALRLGAEGAIVNEKIAGAEIKRRALLAICTATHGEAGLRACESAWLPGAPDEGDLFKRRAALLQAAGRKSAALSAYLEAARLRPQDPDVARAIVALSDRAADPDAALLTARGAALLKLNRPAEAIAVLRRALALAPDLKSATMQLRVAQRAYASGRRQRTLRAAAASAAESAKTGGGRYSNVDAVSHSN
ncbi:MAG TPA: tetratricopeptide repeat protein [Steroidobacteraceae bacterium]|nr:tetratricopeptide repeat protein [Steroidobacteraceae bacterium]